MRLTLLALAFACAAPVHAQSIDTLRLREDTRVLAADSLRGRDTGSEGERAAARYIAGRLTEIGVAPLADGHHIARLPLLRVRPDTAARVRVIIDDDTLDFGHDSFVALPGGRGSLAAFAGPAVYVQATTAAAAEADLAGRTVVTFGPLGEGAAAVLERWIEQRVAGILLPVLDPEQFAQLRESGTTRDLLVDAAVNEPVWQPDVPIIMAGPALSRALISVRPPHQTAGLDTPHELGLSVEATPFFHAERLESRNVAGVIEGSDPAMRDEYIVLTAHYDHLGTGPAIEGDSIYNGFSDNAAGVAMLLAIAEQLHDEPPARSVIFLFTSGEERGLLGSAYWAAHPPVPLERLHAVVNLDAGAPPAPPVRWRVAGDTTSRALLDAATVVRENGWTADVTPANANSDHWPFLARGIPAVFLVPGAEWEDLDETGRDRLRERWDRYHAPGDEWHPDFPFAGLARYAALARDIVRHLASTDTFR